VWKDADHKLGTNTTCPYENCGKTFQTK
jgi:hypothetical protein